MKNIRAIGNRWAALLGAPGVIGIGLLLFSLGFYNSAIAPGQERVEQMRAKVERLQQKSGSPQETRGVPGPLSDFYGFFPPFDAASEGLGRLYALAAQEGLDLPKGEYRLANEAQGQIITYQAIFPLKGTYIQLRRFIVAMLNELPYISLDDLRLEKQRTGDTVVDSQIKLTFYLRIK